MRTYYLTAGEGRCSGRDHYDPDDCACDGRAEPVVTTRRPSWPDSSRYIRVRASYRQAAIRTAVQRGGANMTGGGAHRLPGANRGRGYTAPGVLDAADADVM